MRKRKDMSDDIFGKRFGNLIVIGDTGKLNSNNRRIFIARHVETGEIIETTYTNLKNKTTTGHKNDLNYYEIITKRVTEGRSSLTEKEEKNRSIKATIANLRTRKGYSFDKRRNKYAASIQIDGVKRGLGNYHTEAEAKAARKKAVDEQIKILKNQLEKDDL